MKIWDDSKLSPAFSTGIEMMYIKPGEVGFEVLSWCWPEYLLSLSLCDVAKHGNWLTLDFQQRAIACSMCW